MYINVHTLEETKIRITTYSLVFLYLRTRGHRGGFSVKLILGKQVQGMVYFSF